MQLDNSDHYFKPVQPQRFLLNTLLMSISTKLLSILIISLLMVKDWYQYSDYGNNN